MIATLTASAPLPGTGRSPARARDRPSGRRRAKPEPQGRRRASPSQRANALVSASSRSRGRDHVDGGAAASREVQRRRLFASSPISDREQERGRDACAGADAQQLQRNAERGGGDEHDQPGEPEPVGEEPEEREDERPPGKAVLDEDGALERPRRPRARRRRRRAGCRFSSQQTLQSVPLVEGTRPSSRGSSATALRSARASPLKQLSAIWWLLSP